MNIRMNRIAMSLMCMLFIAFTACKDGKKEEEKMKMEAEKVEMEMKEAEKKKMEEEKMVMAKQNSIAGKAMATESLSTLVAAVKAADLAEMLSEPGEYTVFAPSNDAFSKLPNGTVENLLKPENKATLQSVLQYHVVSGKVTSEKLLEAIKGANGKYIVKTVTGNNLMAMLIDGKVIIQDSSGNNSEVIQADVDASNGVVHIVDNVLMAKK